MGIVLAVVMHLLLLGSMVAFLGAAVAAVRDTRNRFERLLRAGAAFAGALVVLGSQAAGVTFSDFIVDSLAGSTMMGNGAKVVSIVIPSALGVILGMYFLRAMKRDRDRALRVFAFIGTLAAVQFAQIYAVAVDTRGLNIGAAAIPNISFVVAILLYAALKYENTPSRQKEQSKIAAFAEKFTASKLAGASSREGRSSGQQFAAGPTGTDGFSAAGSPPGFTPAGSPAAGGWPTHQGPTPYRQPASPPAGFAPGAGNGWPSDDGDEDGLLDLRRGR